MLTSLTFALCVFAGLTVFVDKRITVRALKRQLEPFVGTNSDMFKVRVRTTRARLTSSSICQPGGEETYLGVVVAVIVGVVHVLPLFSSVGCVCHCCCAE